MKNKRRQFSRSSVIYIIFGIALIGVMTLIAMSVFMRVNQIIITGAVIYTPQQVVEASGVSRGDNLLYMNAQTVSQKIRKELPYINTVEISRDLPDKLSITVTESTPVAYILSSGNVHVIDNNGRVLEILQASYGTVMTLVIGTEVSKLIEVRGVTIGDASIGNQIRAEQGTEPNFQAMQSILLTMDREDLNQYVDYLDVSNITNIHFGFKGLYRVILGGVADQRSKLARLQSDIAILQERYPNARGVYNMSDPFDYRFSVE